MPCISPVRALLPILLIALPTHSVSSPFQALPADSSLLTVAAVGDIMMGSTYPESAALPLDPEGFLRPFEPTLRSAELVFANLEGPLLEGGTTSKCSRLPAPSAAGFNCFAFRVPPLFGGVLRQAGFNVVSLANNHAGDFGEQGRSSTRAVLDQLGIRHVGSSREKYAATLMEVRGKRIGLIGFAHNDVSPTINDVESARDLVAKLKQKSDLVIVSFHGGGEGGGPPACTAGQRVLLGGVAGGSSCLHPCGHRRWCRPGSRSRPACSPGHGVLQAQADRVLHGELLYLWSVHAERSHRLDGNLSIATRPRWFLSAGADRAGATGGPGRSRSRYRGHLYPSHPAALGSRLRQELTSDCAGWKLQS